MPSVLPEHILKRMSPTDRKQLGKAGMTAAEAADKAQVKNERDLSKLIVNYLRLHGIEPLVHRTDKKSTATKGWPDITFAISCKGDKVPGGYDTYVVAVVWELKHGYNKLEPDQVSMAEKLQTPPNCWIHRVIKSFEQAREHLRELGIGSA